MGGWEGEGRKEGERNSFSRRCTSDNNATLNFPFYKVKMPLPLLTTHRQVGITWQLLFHDVCGPNPQRIHMYNTVEGLTST